MTSQNCCEKCISYTGTGTLANAVAYCSNPSCECHTRSKLLAKSLKSVKILEEISEMSPSQNWKSRFDEKFNYATFCWNGDNATGKKFAEQQKRKVKNFFSQERTLLLEELAGEIEGLDTYKLRDSEGVQYTNAEVIDKNTVLSLIKNKINDKSL